MSDIKKQVEFILKSYATMQNEARVLEFELQRIDTSLSSEAIEGAVFSHSGNERVSGSHHSDKTSNIVVEHIDRQRNGRYHALSTLIHNMRFELHRMDYYLSLLPEDEMEVIRWFYFDKLNWSKIAEKAEVVQRTMERRKKRGVENLVYYYSILDRLDPERIDIKTRVRFISYLHEERFSQCLERAEKHRSPGNEAILYILSGCNELWQAGVETFFDFSTGITKSYIESKNSLSGNGVKLLRIAYHFTNSFDEDDLIHIFRCYFNDLEYIHLELAIEAVKLVLFPGSV